MAPPEPRPGAERTSQHADPAIHQALVIVGQPLNPVRVADTEEIRQLYARAPGVGAPPPGIDAFRAPGDVNDPHIYVNRESPVYRAAAGTSSSLAILVLAGTLVHEQVHNTDREPAARRVQADFVRSRLGHVRRQERDAAQRYLERLELRARAIALAGR